MHKNHSIASCKEGDKYIMTLTNNNSICSRWRHEIEYNFWLTSNAQQNLVSLSNDALRQQHRLDALYGTPLQHPTGGV